MNEPGSSPPMKDPAVAGVLAWLLPGLGHLYQGRTAKGLLFFVCLMGTFVWGMYLGEWKVVYWAWDEERKPLLEGLCRLGMGLPSATSYVQSFRRDGTLPVLGRFQAAPSRAELQELNARLNRRWDIAKIYTMIASLLNILVILDALAGPAELAHAPVPSPNREAAPS